MLKRMDLKTVSYDTYEGHMNSDRIYQTGYVLYELDTNKIKFSDGEHYYKDLPYISSNSDDSDGLYKIISELDESEKTIPLININVDKSHLYVLSEENSPKINPETGIITFPNGIKNYYTSNDIDEITGQMSSKVDRLENTVARQGEKINRLDNDETVLIKFDCEDVEAKICSTIAENIRNTCETCECESCKGCKLRDILKVSKKHSPTINLKTGDFTINGVLYPNGGIDGFIDEETYRTKIEELEQRIAELERRLPIE